MVPSSNGIGPPRCFPPSSNPHFLLLGNTWADNLERSKNPHSAISPSLSQPPLSFSPFSFSPSLSPLLASTEPWLQPALHLPAASAALTEGNAAPNWHADRFPSSNTAARRLSAEKEEEEEEEEVEG